MKLSMIYAGAFAAVVASGTVAMAGECTPDILNGHYTYVSQGFTADGKPYGEAGFEHFDGKGNIKNVSSVAGDAEVTEEAGTYTLNDNCTGTAVYASGVTYNIFVAPNGGNFVFTSTEPGVVKSGENTRVAAD